MDRIVIVAQASNSYNRLVGRLISRLSDFTSPDDSSFKPAGKPTLDVPRDWDPPKPQGSPPAHQALNVSSVVDVHLWDKAGWRGILFGIRNGVPLLALAFEDCDAGDKLIARWRERFGAQDRHETIYVAVVTGVSDAEPANYTVLITSRVYPSRDNATGGTTMYLGRHLTMTPRTSVNLDAFLRTYEAVGIYELATAKMDGKTAEPVIGRGILKRHLSVRRLQEIEPDDPEAMLRPSWGWVTSPARFSHLRDGLADEEPPRRHRKPYWNHPSLRPGTSPPTRANSPYSQPRRIRVRTYDPRALSRRRPGVRGEGLSTCRRSPRSRCSFRRTTPRDRRRARC